MYSIAVVVPEMLPSFNAAVGACAVNKVDDGAVCGWSAAGIVNVVIPVVGLVIVPPIKAWYFI